MLNFNLQQIQLAQCKPQKRRYSVSLLVACYLIHAVSRSAYETLREQNFMCLPSAKTLSKITQNVDANVCGINTEYLTLRYKQLTRFQSTVAVIFDEVYVAKRLEYSFSHKAVVGLTDDAKIAGTVLTFMISSICGSYKDVVSMFPINNISSEKIRKAFWQVVETLSKIGFNTVAAISDNHSSNRKFFLDEMNGSWKNSIPNRFNSDRPIFIIFDPTHNLKNLYNNFLSRGTFILPGNIKIQFSHISELVEEEKQRPIKIAPQIQERYLHPSNLDKLSTKPALAVFNEKTEQALRFYSDQVGKEWTLTADFIKRIVQLWKILNVKSPNIGKHKRDIFRDPVRSSYDFKLEFLHDFFTFLNEWESASLPGLTKPTFIAWKQTCSALIAVCKHLRD